VKHPVVPAGPTGRLNESRHVLATEAEAELEARLSPLAHLEQRAADGPAIAEAHVGLDEPGRGEVFPEGSRRIEPRQVAELGAPRGVVVARVVVHRLVHAAVMTTVGLSVADEPFGAEEERALDRLLVHRARHLSERAHRADRERLEGAPATEGPIRSHGAAIELLRSRGILVDVASMLVLRFQKSPSFTYGCAQSVTWSTTDFSHAA
jgi:hypothetical protein